MEQQVWAARELIRPLIGSRASRPSAKLGTRNGKCRARFMARDCNDDNNNHHLLLSASAADSMVAVIDLSITAARMQTSRRAAHCRRFRPEETERRMWPGGGR